VANHLRRRRPSSCTAAPSPVRQGHRRRVSEACDTGRLLVGGGVQCAWLGKGRTMDETVSPGDRGQRPLKGSCCRCGAGAVVGRSIVDPMGLMT
jgi:hypothetical protein